MEKNICMKGYHHHPGHPKSNKDGCMKNKDMEKIKENYGMDLTHFVSLDNTTKILKNPFDLSENYLTNYTVL